MLVAEALAVIGLFLMALLVGGIMAASSHKKRPWFDRQRNGWKR